MPLSQRPIASPFDAKTQAGEVVRDIDLHGKTAIVTGAASGLGVETVRALACAGARVVMPVRSREKGEKVAADIRASSSNNAVEVADMDIGDYKSVRAFADGFVKSGSPLHILINNAGIMATPERRIMGQHRSTVRHQPFGPHAAHLSSRACIAKRRAWPHRGVIIHRPSSCAGEF